MFHASYKFIILVKEVELMSIKPFVKRILIIYLILSVILASAGVAMASTQHRSINGSPCSGISCCEDWSGCGWCYLDTSRVQAKVVREKVDKKPPRW
jgi:hypothetical protein